MSFAALKEKIIKIKTRVKIAVVQPDGKDIFQALKTVCDEKLCQFVLIGSKKVILEQAEQINLADYEIISASDDKQAAYMAMKLINENNADLLMKGNISSDILLKAVLDKENGLRTKNLLSHLAVLETHDHKFLGITDGGMNIQPSLTDKASIINNAVRLFHSLGIDNPKVAILSATEKINPKISSSVDAVDLIEIAKRGEIKDAIIYGPVAFDLAISERARQIKGVSDKISYDADILLVPDIVCGNSVAKALIYCSKLPSGGLVLGAKCPIILLSRADSTQEKLNSIILGIIKCMPF